MLMRLELAVLLAAGLLACDDGDEGKAPAAAPIAPAVAAAPALAAGPAAGLAPGAVATAVTKLQLKVDGMSCGACEMQINSALGKLDGVSECQASAADGSAAVTFDPSKLDRGRIVAAIKELGYSATVAKP
jgi:copper chaperone